MSSFRPFLLVIAAALCLAFAPAAYAAPADDASHYIQGLGDQALAVISNKALDKNKKQAKLEKIFGDNVDFPWVGRFVMGRYWRQATDDQKTRYLKAYQKFLILHYTSRFTDYTSGTFKVLGVKDDGEGEFTVSMQMQSDEPNSEPVLVDYRVRQAEKGFEIFDVIVEGVSLIATQRSEFSSVITNRGIDYLIDQLAARSKTGDITLTSVTASKP
ncbi:MAG: ABC transporter substrate-binding protein [Pseudomonadota bacterium]|nr:ABC transporter substrate-binding protein [Pseudomonadota bacterium]